MKKPHKLSLDVDVLTVETFSTDDEAPASAGTVHGHLGPPTEPRTCPASCAATNCYNTCACPSWSGAECNTVCIG